MKFESDAFRKYTILSSITGISVPNRQKNVILQSNLLRIMPNRCGSVRGKFQKNLPTGFFPGGSRKVKVQSLQKMNIFLSVFSLLLVLKTESVLRFLWRTHSEVTSC